MQHTKTTAGNIPSFASPVVDSTGAFAQTAERSESLKPFVVPAKEMLVPGPGMVDVRILIRANQTNNQFSSIEGAVAPRQMGPAPHLHKDLDELMYVLEGTASVLIGTEVYEVKAGGFIFRPHGIVHSFWNASDVPLRFMDCFFNQNFEDYLEELFHSIIPDMLKANLTPFSPEIAKRIEALDEEFGVTWFHSERQAIIDKYGLNG